MSDSYQAIYDAVRSRISNGDIGSAVSEAARSAFDISYLMPIISQQMQIAIYDVSAAMRRPSTLYRPQLTKDGNAWIALYGEDLQVGVIGCGDTPEAAMVAFDEAWLKS